VQAGRDAVAATPASHPERAGYLNNLGSALQALFERTTEAETRAEALECFRAAARMTAAPSMERIAACRQVAVLANSTDRATGWEGLAAVEAAVDLVEMVAPGSLGRPDRQHQLGQLAGLAGEAAAAAVAAGRSGRAVELLERTRGILVADTLAVRGSDQARLRDAAPDLADQVDNLRTRLDALDHIDADATRFRAGGTSGDPQQIRRQAHQLAAARQEAHTAWRQLLDRIRARDGFADFLRPRIDQLAAQAGEGPVVFVTSSPTRCDALILTATHDHSVRVVPLTDLTQDDIYQHADQLLVARHTAADRDTNPARKIAAQQEILTILGWLWDTITEPVLTALGHTTSPDGTPDGQRWPRVWWCPVGAAAFLPLHAAGHHSGDPAHAASPRTVLDRVVSSYTPTLRGLAYARAHQPDPTGPLGTGAAGMVIVSVPDAPDTPPLPGVTAETTALTTLIPGADVFTDPTRQTVLDALPAYRIAHFACHAYADWDDPAGSRLILPDHQSAPLTVADISALHLHSGLAYLSACNTTLTRPDLADESVHITGAFHLAGYQHVIGTLWPVDDAAAHRLAHDIYTHLTARGTTPPDINRTAHALHHATRNLRARYPKAPTLWAAHTHTGT
jgi:CHAT domain